MEREYTPKNKSLYETTIELASNEAPAKINKETGAITEIIPKQALVARMAQKVPKDPTMKYFKEVTAWQRVSTKAWELLRTQTTEKECFVAFKLGLLAHAYTNSLEPITPNSTITDIAEYLGENRNTIAKIIDKLFRLGVIGKFEVYTINETYQNYWIFNPYLSFNGKIIKKEVDSLFRNTYYANVL
jgi:predicted transcriptional regulator